MFGGINRNGLFIKLIDLTLAVLKLLCTVCVFHTIPYAYGTYRTRTVRTIRVWYVFLYHTRMVVPYAYTVSHSIKLSIGTGGSIPNA